jgi:hypothetical protein
MKNCNTLPNWAIWGMHLVFAGVLIAMGSLMVIEDEKDDAAKPLNIGWAIFLIVLACLAIAYHSHFMVTDLLG